MTGMPAILLKRSDGPYYKIQFGRFGADVETIAASFNDFEFTVHPVFIAVHTVSEAPAAVNEAIQAMPLRNGWFKADSLNSAASILYKALDLGALGFVGEARTLSSNLDPEEHGEQPFGEEAQPAEDEAMDAEVNAQIWKHLEPCAKHDANTAAEIRRDLIQKLGKAGAKQIIHSCETTIAKTDKGRTCRVLKSNGNLLKLKRQNEHARSP